MLPLVASSECVGDVRVHTRRRRPGYGQALRQRLLTDDHLAVRGFEPELQEHVQTETAAAEMAGRRQHSVGDYSHPRWESRVWKLPGMYVYTYRGYSIIGSRSGFSMNPNPK